jgi:hemerythrin
MPEVFFKWSDKYSVGIKTIDSQHQELVNIINRLFDAVTNHEADKVINSILDALMDYTKTHFALEELLMQRANYKDFVAHKREHEKLINELDRLVKQHMVEEKPIYFQTLSFLKSWLRDHIMGVDTKYSEALSNSNFSVDEWELQATVEFDKMAETSGKWWKIW